MKVVALLLLPAGLLAQGLPGRGPGDLQIRVVQSSGPVHVLGTRSSSALTVVVTDASGNPVPGVAVSFQLPAAGPGGVFANGLTTDVVITGPGGRASSSAVRWNKIPGPCDIRVTAAKDGLRAVLVSPHRLLASVTGLPGAPAAVSAGHGRRRVVLIVAGVAAGSVAAGLAVGRRVSAGAGSAPSGGAALSMGTPTITVGGPK
jgi:hypothetical protein